MIDQIYDKYCDMKVRTNKYPKAVYLGRNQYIELRRELDKTMAFSGAVQQSVREGRSEIFNMKIYEVDSENHLEVA